MPIRYEPDPTVRVRPEVNLALNPQLAAHIDMSPEVTGRHPRPRTVTLAAGR
jgi:hypothetical protein